MMPKAATRPQFVISLDFEMMWGVRDHANIQTYGKNILGVREAIPAMLDLFKVYKIRATWGAVGMLLFDSKKSLLDHIPSLQPSYVNVQLSPYPYLNHLGKNEKEDPYHYGLSLAQQIVDCDGMELGSHTFSHYYCLERGQSDEQFGADLEASVAACHRVSGVAPTSLIFPRNQYRKSYLHICQHNGFRVFRGNEKSWVYRKHEKKDSSLKRLIRLADSMVNITGEHLFVPREEEGMLNAPASRFLRPYSRNLSKFGGLQQQRIMRGMTAACRSGEIFHLWWHPHNFGANLQENLIILESVLIHYRGCQEKYDMISSNMGDLS